MADMTVGTSEWVTIATYPTPAEAAMARGAIESAGIPVNLRGESANVLMPVAFATQLQVPSAEEAAARQVLDDAPMSMAEVTAAEVAGEGNGE